MLSSVLSALLKPIPSAHLHEVHFPRGIVKAILTDIEGTTTSIASVKEGLFTYAKIHVKGYLKAHQHEEAVKNIMEEISPGADLNKVVDVALDWMNKDLKMKPLKTLQGMIWKEGYEDGTLKGHLYLDAKTQMEKWKKEGFPLFVFSSGSVQAQRDLFSHSIFGDLSHLFSGNFDTQVGTKTERESYEKIGRAMNRDPREVLFLSDVTAELDAAKAAGFKTVLLCRDTALPQDCPHPAVSDFNQIRIG